MKVEKAISWLKRFCGKNMTEISQQNEISRQKRLDNLTKMIVCDFCFEEANQYKRKKKDINRCTWKSDMLHKSLRLCNEHMNELCDCLCDLRERGEI